jgi:dolichol-phosphate mannosyltransferase
MKASIVIPAFNEEDALRASLPVIYKQLINASQEHLITNFEILVINDGSTDDTQNVTESFFKDMRKYDLQNFFRVISFPTNQGHMKAITVGMSACEADFVITIDADLQDPPEAIPAIINLYIQTLTPCIQTVRVNRAQDTFLKRHSASLYYNLIKKITGVAIVPHAADFRLLANREAKMLASLSEHKKIFRLLVPYFAIPTLQYPIERATRVAGRSKYSLRKMMALAIDSLLAFSTKPLRWIMLFSASSLGLFLLFATYALYKWRKEEIAPGWTSISIVISFGFTVTLCSLWIIGEYIARIYNLVLNRPTLEYSEKSF